MPFGLVLHSERAAKLQQSIQDELIKRGYSPESDNVMAEYLTIMIINNKTPAQITGELEDLIGIDFDPSFTDWLFGEAAKGAGDDSISNESPSSKDEPPAEPEPELPRDEPPHSAKELARVPRNGVYQQALAQAIPSGSSAQKRAASARSPSPSHPSKFRKTDLPTGPRAMHRDGTNSGGSSRSLLDRVGGPAGRNVPNHSPRDEIQARIDSIVNNAEQSMMMPPGFPGMMEMNSMAAASMSNPILLQEMMMNQMALMAQMASSMGIINPATGQFAGQGFPMQQGVVPPGDMNMFPPNMNNGFPSQQGGGNPPTNNAGRGRGSTRGGRGSSRGRGGFTVGGSSGPLPTSAHTTPAQSAEVTRPAPLVAAPVPIAPTHVTAAPTPAQPAYAIPERPQSPTLCKFGLKCTNTQCRYSHPSPVATAESGIVLSNDPCEKGKDCKNKDCIKAHVSPAVLNPNVEQSIPKAIVPPAHVQHNTPIPCRFGAACTRPGCTYSHPPRPTQSAVACRFGAACTRAQCPFQHPDGRVLPSTFHRGLSASGPMVNIATPEPGTMGGPSPHRSMTFNHTSASMKEKLEKQMKVIEEKKNQAEKAVKDAEAAATGKKEATKVVPITA